MLRDLAGRAIAVVGLTAGLLAVSLSAASGGGDAFRYVDDGTIAAFLLTLIALSSWLPAEVGPPALGAACGAAGFGFFLFVPAAFAFDSLDYPDAGAWLGLGTALIPIGALLIWSAEPEQEREPAPAAVGDLRRAVALGGLALVLAGIWLPAESGGDSYWNLSSSGHALGILMLLLVALNVVLASPLASFPRAPDVGLLVAAATFGLVEAELVADAFERLGSLGSGAWVEACGGVLLLLGIAGMSSAAVRPEPEAAALTDSGA